MEYNSEIVVKKQAETTEISTNNNHTTSVIDSMSRAYKLAQVYCTAGNIPDTYKNKPADCMIAIDMAERMNVTPLFVMQNMYVVKGKPSWSGQACKSLIKNSGEFKEVETVYFGEKGTDTRGCRIEAIRVKDGKKIEGAEVTIAMAKSEGWTSNKKWINMPELMLAYRAAAFFCRVHCPELLMGMQVESEVEDITADQKPCTTLTNALKGVNNAE